MYGNILELLLFYKSLCHKHIDLWAYLTTLICGTVFGVNMKVLIPALLCICSWINIQLETVQVQDFRVWLFPSCCVFYYIQTHAPHVVQVVAGSHGQPANIGELFSEGSLNPYADDPYAFDWKVFSCFPIGRSYL
jgi:hypothetical protein